MLNIAVVGCGYWGPNLIRNFSALAECRMKIACDLDKDRLAHMKSLYPGLETTTEFDHVINDSETDAIVIATPVRFHYEMAKKSLEAVFIMKWPKKALRPANTHLLKNPWLHLWRNAGN
jgi:predicted dehydrogenase